MSLINRDDNNVWDKAIMGVHLEVHGHNMHLDFHAMHMTRANTVARHKWLHGLGPLLKCTTSTTLLLLMLMVHMFF